MPTRVINLSVNEEGLPIINGSHHVTEQINRYYTAMSDAVYGPSHKYHPEYATIYKSESGKFLVHADSKAILDVIGSGELLADLVDNDPKDWYCYYCATELSNGEEIEIYLTLKDADKMDKKLSKDKPYKYKDDEGNKVYIIGAQASVPSKCGKMNPDDIKVLTPYWGDVLT